MAIEPLNSCGYNCFPKAIPAAFDESISYLEMLAGILKKQTELIAQVNKNTDFIEHWNTSLEDIYAQIENLKLSLNSQIMGVNNKIELEINTLNNTLRQYILEQRNIIEANASVQYTRLENLINQVAVGQINVVNPVTGQVDSLQNTLYSLYEGDRESALTATEYDALELTASAYIAYDCTAIQYDRNGKNILV